RLKVLELPDDGGFEDLVKLTRADAIFTGTRWRTFDPSARTTAKVPVFEPVIGLSDEEIRQLGDRIRAA
ncbi:MAG: hypothetical protein L3J78_02475, partial [Thermoplasmata archaeon]|nr:hypothetical protein [Thermoplasmata archaeon]